VITGSVDIKASDPLKHGFCAKHEAIADILSDYEKLANRVRLMLELK